MHSHVQTIITLHSNKSDACVLYARVIDQSTVDILPSHGSLVLLYNIIVESYKGII